MKHRFFKDGSVYEIDNLADRYGHIVHRLPPYNYIFNAIKETWGILKIYYARYVGESDGTMKDSKRYGVT